jgi:hypothetical protein
LSATLGLDTFTSLDVGLQAFVEWARARVAAS